MNKALFIALGALASSSAWATDCASVLNSYSTPNYSPSVSASNASYHPECFASSSATSSAQIAATSFQQVSIISDALAARQFANDGPVSPELALAGRGLAAGGKNSNITVWGHISNGRTHQNYNANTSNVDSSLSTDNVVLGVDYVLSSKMLAGVSLSMDRTDGSQYNTGSASTTQLTSHGYSLAPYLGWQINKNLSLDASLGLGRGKTSVTGGSSDSNRWFAATNLIYSAWKEKLQYTAKASLLHGEEKQDDMVSSSGTTAAGTGATAKVDRMRVSSQIGYWNQGVMPYIGIGYSTDLSRSGGLTNTDPIGRSAWTASAGVHLISVAKGVTGGIAYNVENGRNNQNSNNLMANLSVRF